MILCCLFVNLQGVIVVRKILFVFILFLSMFSQRSFTNEEGRQKQSKHESFLSAEMMKYASSLTLSCFFTAFIIDEWLEEGENTLYEGFILPKLFALEEYFLDHRSARAAYQTAKRQMPAFLKQWKELTFSEEASSSREILQILKEEDSNSQEGAELFLQMIDSNRDGLSLGYTHSGAIEAYFDAENIKDPYEKTRLILNATLRYLVVNGRFYRSAAIIALLYKNSPYDQENLAASILEYIQVKPYIDTLGVLNDPVGAIAVGASAKVLFPFLAPSSVESTAGLLAVGVNLVIFREILSLGGELIDNKTPLDQGLEAEIPTSYPIKTPEELYKEAVEVLHAYKSATPVPIKHDLGQFLLYSEWWDQKDDAQIDANSMETQQLFSRLEQLDRDNATYKDIVDSNTGEKPFLAQVDRLRKSMHNQYINHYVPDQRSLSGFYDQLGGNCEAQSRLVSSVITKLAPPLGKYEVFGLQVFLDHVQPVIFDKQTGTVTDLISGNIEARVRAPIFHPYLWYYGYLQSHKHSIPWYFSKEDLLLVAKDPSYTQSNGKVSFEPTEGIPNYSTLLDSIVSPSESVTSTEGTITLREEYHTYSPIGTTRHDASEGKIVGWQEDSCELSYEKAKNSMTPDRFKQYKYTKPADGCLFRFSYRRMECDRLELLWGKDPLRTLQKQNQIRKQYWEQPTDEEKFDFCFNLLLRKISKNKFYNFAKTITALNRSILGDSAVDIVPFLKILKKEKVRLGHYNRIHWFYHVQRWISHVGRVYWILMPNTCHLKTSRNTHRIAPPSTKTCKQLVYEKLMKNMTSIKIFDKEIKILKKTIQESPLSFIQFLDTIDSDSRRKLLSLIENLSKNFDSIKWDKPLDTLIPILTDPQQIRIKGTDASTEEANIVEESSLRETTPSPYKPKTHENVQGHITWVSLIDNKLVPQPLSYISQSAMTDISFHGIDKNSDNWETLSQRGVQDGYLIDELNLRRKRIQKELSREFKMRNYPATGLNSDEACRCILSNYLMINDQCDFEVKKEDIKKLSGLCWKLDRIELYTEVLEDLE